MKITKEQMNSWIVDAEGTSIEEPFVFGDFVGFFFSLNFVHGFRCDKLMSERFFIAFNPKTKEEMFGLVEEI